VTRPAPFYERICEVLAARSQGRVGAIRQLAEPLDAGCITRLITAGVLTAREAAALVALPDMAGVSAMVQVLGPGASASIPEWSWAPLDEDRTISETVPALAADASLDDSWDWDQTHTAFAVATPTQTTHDGPRFVLGESVGAGRFFTLHPARDHLLGRDLLVYRHQVSSALSMMGFVLAVRRLARLQHPNILPVYELGVDGGAAFFATALVRHETLGDLLRGLAKGTRSPPLPRLLETVLDVARALAFAHERGTVHRDLRPKHVRLGRFGEVLVGGWFRAHRTGAVPDRDRGLNAVDSGLGYLSPERLEGGLDACGMASDVWGLGALLYAALTRRAPLVGRSSTEVLEALKTHGLSAPSARGDVSVTLDALCMRALVIDPVQRSLTAAAFASELEDYLQGTRAEARRMDTVEAQIDRAHGAARHHASARSRLRLARIAAAEARDPADPHRALPLTARADLLRGDVERWFFEAEAEYDETLALLPSYEPARHGLAVLYRRALQDAERGWVKLPAEALRARLRGLAGPEFEAWDTRPAALELRSEPSGAEVLLYAPIDVEGVRTLDAGRPLGVTPLALEGLHPGPHVICLQVGGVTRTWLSVQLEPGERLALRVPADPAPEGFVRVPEGPCWVGAAGDEGARANALPWSRCVVPGFTISTDLVTLGAWQLFLQATWAVDPQQAAAYAPRFYRGSPPVWLAQVDGYRLPFTTPNGATWHADLPAMGLTPEAVAAYLAWRSAQDERVYALPGELQWAKAARGAEGRRYPWGERPEPNFCHHLAGRPEAPPVGSASHDRSVYGVWDTAGTAREYTQGVDGGLILRGGSWLMPFADAHLAVRGAPTPQLPLFTVGFRMVIAGPMVPGRQAMVPFPESVEPPAPEPFEPSESTHIGEINDDFTVDGRTVLFDNDSVAEGFASAPSIDIETGPKRYTIREEIARGSMGRVMLAWDEVLQRPVALKILHDRHGEDLLARYRFAMEARITGRLQHPNVIPIYDMGFLPGGLRFFAMKPVEGMSLGDVLKGKSAGDRRIGADFGRDRLLTIIRRVCQAVGFAHAHGVVHRDLKPANVLIGDFGEVMLVDLGLARQLDLDPSDRADVPETALLGKQEGRVTRIGSVIGTPFYMSPEQAMGLQELVGPLSDVYGLGSLIYHILALRPPFTGRKINEVLRKVRRGNPQPPSRAAADQDIPEALDMVCMRALSMDPEGRYPSASALADALAAWQEEARLKQRARGLLAERAVRAAEAWRAWEQARAELDQLRARHTALRAELRDAPSAERRMALHSAWAQVRAQGIEVEALVAEVVRRSRLALGEDRPEVHARLLRVLQSRLLRAERSGAQDTARWYRRLLEQFDPDGSVARWLRHGAPLEVNTVPAGLMARVSMQSAHSADRLETLMRGPTPLVIDDVPPGGGVVRIGDGQTDIAVPFRIRRDRPLSIDVPWPDAPQPGFVVVSAGRFLYGGEPQATGSGARSARLPTYRIAVHPVTCGQWRAFLDELATRDVAQAVLRTPRMWIGGPSIWGPVGVKIFGPYDANRPVTGITLADAHTYCAWASARDGLRYRLPTSAEWEKAARGVDGRLWPWGNAPNTEEATPPTVLHPVGVVEGDVSPYGMKDIASGVFEWTLTAAQEDPGLCYLRGDCSAFALQGAACVRRLIWDPTQAGALIGFRMVMT
jgi:eukaryotic-like serine/threonine-protein kinase